MHSTRPSTESYQTPAVKAYDSLYEEAVKLMQSKDLAAFDINKEPGDVSRTPTVKNRFGQGCLLARRLVESGVRFVEVSHGGWDTHYDNFTNVENRAKTLGSGLLNPRCRPREARAPRVDPRSRSPPSLGGRLRIVAEHNSGRDHHPACFSAVMAGGVSPVVKSMVSLIKVGRAYPKTRLIQDFNATIGHALGIDHAQVVSSPSGRPFRLGGAEAELGKPITSIFG